MTELTIDVRALLDRPGSSRRLALRTPVEGLGTELATVTEDVAIDALLESIVEGVLVTGTIAGPVTYRCARCLKPFEGEVRAEVTELFVRDGDDADDQYAVSEGSVDLEPMVRDAVILDLPFAPLCREDCLGLCERCGGDRNLGECSCPPRVDPRWAALGSLDLE